MTMNEKIAELEAQGYIKNDSYEVYENARDGWTVQVFTSPWSFEEYSFADQSVKDMHMKELIKAVDSLKFN